MATNVDTFGVTEPGTRDMGFGEAAARDSRLRLLNRDGTFNTGRHGVPRFRSVPVYEHLTRVRWKKFYLFTVLAYLTVDLVFAVVYFLLGPGALAGATATTAAGRFAEAFFFSVHTVTTVGYGSLAPASTAANLVVAVEAFLGLAGFAVFAALLFARLSQPTADIRFSPRAVVAPYLGGSGFMFRIANASRGELVDASVMVMFSWIDGDGPDRRRRFEALELERSHIAFFPMHWTVVHPIDERSPLRGWDADRLRAARAEFLIQVAATAETYANVVRTRSSYVADEVDWNHRFSNILEPTDSGALRIDVRRIGEIEPAGV